MTDGRMIGASHHGWMGSSPPKVLMIIENVRLLRTVTRVMHSLGANSVVASDLFAVRDMLTDDPDIDLFVYDFETPVESREARDSLLREVSSIDRGPAWILLSERQDPDRLIDLFSLPYKGSVVAKIGELSSADLLVTARKLLSGDIFGVDKYLQWGSVVHAYKIRESSARQVCGAELESFLREISTPSRLRSELCTVADEFLMNALYDAPINESGEHTQKDVSRRQQVTVDDDVTFEFGCDGRFVAIGCRDPFGSLVPARVLESLVRCFKAEEDQIRQHGGGAGIGLFLIYRFVDCLVVNIQKGVATEFLGLVDLWSPAKKRKLQGKTLNIFNLS